MSESENQNPSQPAPKPTYVPAVGARLRKLLYAIFGLLAVIGANSGYLASITFLEWTTGQVYQNYFYQYMFLGHLILGLIFIVPFLIFAILHMKKSSGRRNRIAVRVGYALFAASLVILITGLLLMRVSGFDLKHPLTRSIVYWLHVIGPVIAGWLYWLHRLAGPRIKWRIGFAYATLVAIVVTIMVDAHSQDPRQRNIAGPESGVQYFEPSLARTASGKFIPARSLMNDEYCKKCHADVHAGWSDSVHRFSSFNNPPYLASVSETREVVLKRDGNVQASRWCAGCHDPVPFFSGAFDDPRFDMLKHPTAQAGITCTVCHSITNINSNRGNADYTIEEPLHYPFAYSDNEILQWVNNQLVKAKPSFHKKMFLKPFHKTEEFCSSCHKVHLPYELNHYKEFLRGQNHYDSYLLSGVSGHGAKSFYYPPVAETNCNGCHMPLQESNDFGAQLFPGTKKLSIHDHLFPSANTGISWLRNKPDVTAAHQQFLQEVMRVDIFGIRNGSTIDGELTAPLRPEVPTLLPGGKYLLESVIRTVKMGHHFTQGTVDSNEIWLDVTVTSNGHVIGRSGSLDPHQQNKVDPWAHFVNVFLLDKEGNRIDRRNAQDIFTPLYNHQIPPGAGQTVHYSLELPDNLSAPVTVELKLQYRKFDQQYMDFVARTNENLGAIIRGHKTGEPYLNQLPVTTLAVDSVTFPIKGINEPVSNPSSKIPTWQRWNDYGIGLLLKGKVELRQAAHAFTKVEELERYDGPLNLARVFYREGRLDEAVTAIQRAAKFKNPAAPSWTLAWLSGLVNREQGRLTEAEANFRNILERHTVETEKHKFDFSRDYEVINLLGQTLFDQARQIRDKTPSAATRRKLLLQQSIDQFLKVLTIDSENVTAYYNLQLLYSQLGDNKTAKQFRDLHEIYKADDTAQGRAIRLAREKYPAANNAAEAVVIYPLNRPNAPGLRANDNSQPPQDENRGGQ